MFLKVKGRDKSPSDINSEKLAGTIKNLPVGKQGRKSSLTVLYLKNSNNLKKEIENIIALSPKLYPLNFIIIMMGAGDIYKMTDNLIK